MVRPAALSSRWAWKVSSPGSAQELKDGTYRPLPARERLIPKRSGKLRSLGISTVRDRIVQTAAKLVLEPIFEADFCPTSYGFRPGRRAQDAIEQVRFFINAPRSYEWVIEGDVEDCFGSIHQGLLMEQVRRRVTDKRVLALIRLFLAAGIMREQGPWPRRHRARHKAGYEQLLITTPYEQRWVMRSVILIACGRAG